MAKENNKNDSTQLLVDLFERIKRTSYYGYNEFSKKEKNEALCEIFGICESFLITLRNTER